MDRERRVQVVVGEAEPTGGILRFVLEGEGFDIVGLASSDEELARVLKGARPSVIVLDGGISAAAALEAREHANGATLVVVWPEGVAAVVAEERVDPHLVIDDLGHAVRRASRRTSIKETPIRIPDAVEHDPPIEKQRAAQAPAVDDPPEPVRPIRSRRRVLVSVATWILFLTSLTTIAVAVPNAFELFSGDRGPRPSRSAVASSRPSGRTSVVDAMPTRTGQDDDRPSGERRCEPKKERIDRGKPSTDRRADRGPSKACRPDDGKGDGHGNGQDGGGRPDDPGNGVNKGPAQGGAGTRASGSGRPPGRAAS